MIFPRTAIYLAALSAVLPLSGQSLRNAGIIGNSGEQGASLVRFAEKPVVGMGVVYDRFGTLWDRAGDGRLNRYAPDGRLLASWKIPPRKATHMADSLVLIDDTLLFKQERKLYTLRIDAAPDAAPTLLPVEVTHLSASAHQGWAAAARESEVFLVNLAGETRPVAAVPDRILDVEMGPEGGVYGRLIVNNRTQVFRLDAAAPDNARGPWGAPGNRFQWLNDHWFGHDGHGTVRRFSPGLNPDPGVVLGGNSGSFIGYVPGNYDLMSGRGLAHLGGPLYAVSGINGIMHLLEWVPADRRFNIIRRIGAVPSCAALAIDRHGRVWYHGGMWEWSDGPDVPLRHGVPPAPLPGIIGAGMLESDAMAALSRETVFYGKLDGPVDRRPAPGDTVKNAVVATVVTRAKGPGLLALDREGRGSFIPVGANGQPQGNPKPSALQPAVPLKEITSLAGNPAGGLVATADGHVVEFEPDGDNWRETRRWNSWGATEPARFGGRIFAAVNENRIWVSDTERHRVLCFDISAGRPVVVAAYGTPDKPGDDLAGVNRPGVIAPTGRRAVVFDSVNQRLVRLELESR